MDLREREQAGQLRHPWEQARSRLVQRILRTELGASGPVSLLDAGSGDAWLAWELVAALPAGSSVRCWDANYTDADREELAAAGPPSVTYTAAEPDGDFDVVTALDVVEHVADDVAFVRTLVGHCRPGGGVLVTVPAWQRLYGHHDEVLGHHRRYSPAALHDVLVRGGLEVVRSGGLFQGLLAARAAMAVAERFRPPEGDATQLAWRRGPGVTNAITRGLELEGRAALALAGRGAPPPGLSCWAWCRRATGAP